MKKATLLILIFIISLMTVSADDFTNNRTGIFDMVWDSRVGCNLATFYLNADYYDVFRLGMGPMGWASLSSKYGLGSLGNSEAYCRAARESVTTFMNVNNITDPYQQLNTMEDYQLGLEEYVFNEEKELLLVNINTVWDYTKLMMHVVIEVILILFYVIQFKLIRYFIFELIPTMFFGLRDGLAGMFIRKQQSEIYKKNTRGYNRK